MNQFFQLLNIIHLSNLKKEIEIINLELSDEISDIQIEDKTDIIETPKEIELSKKDKNKIYQREYRLKNREKINAKRRVSNPNYKPKPYVPKPRKEIEIITDERKEEIKKDIEERFFHLLHSGRLHEIIEKNRDNHFDGRNYITKEELIKAAEDIDLHLNCKYCNEEKRFDEFYIVKNKKSTKEFVKFTERGFDVKCKQCYKENISESEQLEQ